MNEKLKVNGKIIDILEHNRVKVEIMRASACGEHCVSCGGCSIKASAIVAECNENVAVNDEVSIEMPDNKVFLLSISLFILPLLSIIISHYILEHFIDNMDIIALLSFFTGIMVFLGFALYSRRLKTPKCTRSSWGSAPNPVRDDAP